MQKKKQRKRENDHFRRRAVCSAVEDWRPTWRPFGRSRRRHPPIPRCRLPKKKTTKKHTKNTQNNVISCVHRSGNPKKKERLPILRPIRRQRRYKSAPLQIRDHYSSADFIMIFFCRGDSFSVPSPKKSVLYFLFLAIFIATWMARKETWATAEQEKAEKKNQRKIKRAHRKKKQTQETITNWWRVFFCRSIFFVLRLLPLRTRWSSSDQRPSVSRPRTGWGRPLFSSLSFWLIDRAPTQCLCAPIYGTRRINWLHLPSYGLDPTEFTQGQSTMISKRDVTEWNKRPPLYHEPSSSIVSKARSNQIWLNSVNFSRSCLFIYLFILKSPSDKKSLRNDKQQRNRSMRVGSTHQKTMDDARPLLKDPQPP